MRIFAHRPARSNASAAASLIAAILAVLMQTMVHAAASTDDKQPATDSTGTPSIVVSIKPLHSLVSAVTYGVTEPVLLFDGFSSPHTAQLKPSMMRQLHNADLLVWVGSGVEVYLERVVSDLNPQSGVISFGQVDGVRRLPFRFDQHEHRHIGGAESTQHSAEAHADEDHADKDREPEERASDWRDAHQADASHSDEADYHFWFDPHNARQLVSYLSQYLAAVDPANSQIYKSNAQQALGRLSLLDQQLEVLLNDLADVPYLVFHDSFQYMEKRYGLHRALVIAEQPEVQPGARRLRQILQRVESQNVKCLFTEPQFPSRVLSMLQRDSSIDLATLDPLASQYDAGPDLYADWLLALGQTMRDCLTR